MNSKLISTVVKLLFARSNKSEVVQEIYGWLLGHYAVRHLMFAAAQTAGISPLRLGFTGSLKVKRLCHW